MKTLQEKYNAIQNNTFSKAQFKRDAIMECGHLVTHYNGYDDIVNILINRGVITEAKKDEPKYSTASAADHIAPDVLDTGIKFECDKKHGTLDVSKEEYAKCRETAIKNLSKDVLYYVKQDSEQLETPGDQMEKVKLSEAKVKITPPGQEPYYALDGKEMSDEEADKFIERSKNVRGETKAEKVNEGDWQDKGQSQELNKERLADLKAKKAEAEKKGVPAGIIATMDKQIKELEALLNEESGISSLEDVLAHAQAYADEKYPELDSEDIGDFIQLHGQEILDGDDLETSFDNFIDHNFSLDEKIDTKLNIKEDVYATLIDQLTQMGLDPTNAKLLTGLAKMSVNIGTVPAIMALIYKNKNNPLIKKGLQKIDPALVDDDSDIAEELDATEKSASDKIGRGEKFTDDDAAAVADKMPKIKKDAEFKLMEDDEDLGSPDVEDLYQNDTDYLTQLKEREALKESFRKLIKNVIEG
jgi:hypothetical protein